ncbi:MAG: hypothetical protein Q8R29_02355 [bacterium]|nr:hypothetical protein [bacterium]
MEKINFPQETRPETETKEAKKERWSKGTYDLLKKFWFASLVVAIPSVAEAKEPVKFEDVWKTLTSGRENAVEIGSTVTERSAKSEDMIKYLRAYRSYNTRLDSLLQLVPVKDLGAYLESYGVDFGSITPGQKDFRFLPVHEEGSGCFATVISWKPETGKKGVIEFNTALMSPTDTTMVGFVSTHEVGHFVRRRKFSIPQLVIEEGLANWGAWKFMKDNFSKKGVDDKEIKTRLKPNTENAYSGETLLAAMIDLLYKKQNVLKEYYAGANDFMSYDGIAGASQKLHMIIHKDIGTDGQLTSSEVLTVLRHLISIRGMDSVKKAYKELRTKYFLDITEKNLGILKWDEGLVYFDKTTEKPPLKTEGDMWISTAQGVLVRFRYEDHDFVLREYDEILSQIKEGLQKGSPFFGVSIDPSVSLKESDGSLRKEIKEILESSGTVELSRN